MGLRCYELAAIYDARKSFYGKARVIEDENGATLISYNTPVAYYDRRENEVTEYNYAPHSKTTSRHFREFCKQFKKTA